MNHVLCGRLPKTSLAQMEAKLRSYRESSLSELMSVLAGVRQEQLWLGHKVKVVDGTGIKLATCPPS